MTLKLRSQVRLTPALTLRAEREVLSALALFAFQDGIVCIYNKNLIEETGYSWTWIRKQIKSLEYKGFLTQREATHDRGVYQINLEKLGASHE